jgi:orotate phosphoribosyltransferase
VIRTSPQELLARQVLDLLASKAGHFVFESGHHGDLWLELDALFVHAPRLTKLVNELASRLARHRITAVCGPLVGGAFLAQTLASILRVEFLYTEGNVRSGSQALYPVQYRLPKGQHALVRDKHIAIVDDVINAGSAVRGTFTELRACGAKPVAIGSLLVLGTSAPSFFLQENVPLERLAQVPNNLWTPGECPLCAAGAPLEDRCIVADAKSGPI